jgi:hypothetical protein
MRFLQLLLSLSLVTLFTSQVAADSGQEPLWVEVIDPYIEMHSGPGRGYPVFYVIEQGEQVDIITRRPGWYEVRTKGGKTGWTTAAQIARTIQTTGEPADLPTVTHGDYLKNSWRAGFNTGQFSGGELQGSELFSFAVGYRPLSWLTLEAERGKIFGTDIKGDFYGANLLVEPFSEWKLSPYVEAGFGTMKVNSEPKLIPLEIEEADFNHYGLGFNYYLGRNFLFKGEYRSYSVSTDNKVSLEAWTIGFNSFF